MNRKPDIQVRAPGKIILSGEHAVVHGKPALVTAVNRHIQTSLWDIDDNHLRIELPTLGSERIFTFHDLELFRSDIRARYDHFLAGTLDIQNVVPQPIDLLACALADGISGKQSGLHLRVDSEIPLGAGMGSSAAAAATVIQAAAQHAGSPLTPEVLTNRVVEIERLQHGHPSGVDPAVCVHGGTMMFEKGEFTPVTARPPAGALISPDILNPLPANVSSRFGSVSTGIPFGTTLSGSRAQ